MVKAYHYARLDPYRRIEDRKRILEARSPLVNTRIAEDTGIAIPDEGFLFCLLGSPEPEQWVKSGWLDHLVGDFLKNRYALLSFQVGEEDPAYVLDATSMCELWKASNGDYYAGLSSGKLAETFKKYLR